MSLTLDHKIKEVLFKLNGSEWSKLLKDDITNWLPDGESVDNLEAYIIVHTLLDEGLIVKLDLSGAPKYHITRKGKTINSIGGWLVHLRNIENEAHQRKRKAIYDLEVSRWLVKSKWWPHVISGAGILTSIIALVVSLQKSPIEEQIQQLQLEQLKQYQDLHRTKPLDSVAFDVNDSL